MTSLLVLAPPRDEGRGGPGQPNQASRESFAVHTRLDIDPRCG